MKRTFFSLVLILLLFSHSHSEYSKDVKVEPLLKTDTTSIGQKINYPDFKNDEVTILKVTIPPGKSTGWHKHTFPVFAYVLKGALTVEVENRTPKQFLENTSFSEVINTFHNGKNDGKEDVVLIAFFMGEKGNPLNILKESKTGEKK
jgi:quercetin dioxygenase-like cupin family protein